ncbi:MAG TPA: FtsX-like permease family protein [Ktedonosporobacter sp.]|jgi:predicted lysophospholipase L1 biosynthesis ABC-type transport system permease subunit|nr:FtsX-like permease family protein [Ktedonosporobacter sp.]
MKLSLYMKYPIRALIREGQRSLLAIFCVAIGVMTIVALQLVGFMVQSALTLNPRDVNGGDLQISTKELFTQNDLSYFADLKRAGTITNYTASIEVEGELSLHDAGLFSFFVNAVDPHNYPIVPPPALNAPAGKNFTDLLTGNQAIVTQTFLNQHHLHIGDTFIIHTSSNDHNSNVALTVKLAGVVSDLSPLALATSRGLVVIPLNTYVAAMPPGQPLLYDTVYVTTANPALADQASRQLQAHFPSISIQIPADVQQQEQMEVDNIRKFLEIAGLLALLIGGVSIMNTMSVVLMRRKTEIAMLKTTGYQRLDIALLFGMEAGLVGLISGSMGIGAAIGVSYLVNLLVAQVLQTTIPFVLNGFIIGNGLFIGLATALIFGLLPIAQAVNTRPIQVLREQSSNTAGNGRSLILGLLLLLSLLYWALATIIVNNDLLLAAEAVYGAAIFLGLLSLIITPLVQLADKLPIPEQLNLTALAPLLVWGVISGLLFLLQPAIGIIAFVIAILGNIAAPASSRWRTNVKLALRNIGNRKGQTTTTILATFIGIFAIGLIIILAPNMRAVLTRTAAKSQVDYNLFITSAGTESTKLQTVLPSLQGLSSYAQFSTALTKPLTINSTPVENLITPQNKDPLIGVLTGIEGYDVGHQAFPSLTGYQITAGRNLNASDAGTDNVVVYNILHLLPSIHLQLGDKITLENSDGTRKKTVTVVGFAGFQHGLGDHIYSMWGTLNTVKALEQGQPLQSTFLLNIAPDKVNQALDTIAASAPNAYAQDRQANNNDSFSQLVNNVVSALTVIASLSLLAGLVIIANSVALAMLARRRELGILKAVGYTRRTILSEILLENAVIGGISAMLAMLLVTIATILTGTFVFHTTFSVNSAVVVAMILGTVALTMLVAALAAWSAVSIRPMEVLRYE